jgi:hypothetical protein
MVCPGNVLIDTTVDAGNVMVVREPEIEVVIVEAGKVMKISGKSAMQSCARAKHLPVVSISVVVVGT